MRADWAISGHLRRLGAAIAVAIGLAAATAGAETGPVPPAAARLGDAWAPVKLRGGLCMLGQVVFAPDGKAALAGAMGTGMCFSRDGGRTWRLWWGGESDNLSQWLGDGTMITLHGEGFWLSRDFGLSGETRHVPGSGVFAMHRDGRRGITVTETGQIHLTEDRWALFLTIGGVSSHKGLGAAIAPDGRTLVAVFAEYWMLTGTIAVSRDFGSNWVIADLPRNYSSPAGARIAFNGAGILIQVQENLLYSADFGRRWWPLSLAGFQPSAEYAFSENLATLLVRDEHGLLLVQPAAGPRWSGRRVLAIQSMKSIALSADGRVGAVVTEEGELFLSRDFGRSWTAAKTKPLYPFAVSLSPDGTTAIVAVEREKTDDPLAFISVGR